MTLTGPQLSLSAIRNLPMDRTRHGRVTEATDDDAATKEQVGPFPSDEFYEYEYESSTRDEVRASKVPYHHKMAPPRWWWRAGRWVRLAAPIALYDDPGCTSLATEAAAGRWCRRRIATDRNEVQWTCETEGNGGEDTHNNDDEEEEEEHPPGSVVEVILREDYYVGWVRVDDIEVSDDVEQSVDAETATAVDVDAVLAFVRGAPTEAPYRWGGTLMGSGLMGYDCSGLVQTAFAYPHREASDAEAEGGEDQAVRGVWLPRDAYQQHAFTTPVRDPFDAVPGDLLFFGPDATRVDHVGVLMSHPEPCGMGVPGDGRAPSRNEEDAVEAADGKPGVILRFAHCSCKSTGRDGVGDDAVFVPRGITSTDGWNAGTSRPRPPAEFEGNPVTEYYARRFLSLGRVTRGVQDPKDVIWRVRT